MRIIHVIGSIDPVGGGPPQVAVRLAAAQATLGHDVHLVTYGHADSASEARINEQLSRVPYLDLLTVHRLPAPTPQERWFATEAQKLLTKLLPDSDWLHLHGVWERILHRAAALAGKRGVPYCFRPAGMLDPWSLGQKSWKKKLALSMGVRRLLDRAAFIHTLNADEAELIAPLALRSPCVVVPNGVFLEEIEPLPERGMFVAGRPQLRGKRLLLFLARLHYKKGLDYLADAWAEVAPHVPNADLVVAGPDDGARRDFEQRIARAGLVDRVYLAGALYGAEKYSALVDANCFCLPSRQEGFSVAVLEALACGLPVVMSPPCHFPEAAAAGAAEVVALDKGELAAALRRVFSDDQRAQAMGRAGVELIRRNYTWQAIAAKSLEAYRLRFPV
jgi:glycosyltransferase involved in cell wall biosynthesis